MAVLTYKGGKYRNLANNKIYDGTQWREMTGNSKIYLNGEWHNLGWQKAELPDVPDMPDVPSWDDFAHLATEEPTTGSVYYMTPTGAGNKDGSSWDNAWDASQIHVAMLTMTANSRLYMAEGDYGTIDRPMTIPDGVSIYGGFIEGDYSWNTRNGFTHPTVWNGDDTFALFDLPAAAAPQEINGVTCDNFKNKISGDLNCVFRNMVLLGGSFSITSLLTNSKSADCVLSVISGDNLLVRSSETADCMFAATLTNSSFVKSNVSVSDNATDCQIIGDLTCYKGTCSGCTCTGTITARKCTNCDATSIKALSVSDCRCYGAYCGLNGTGNKITNANIYTETLPHWYHGDTECFYYINCGYLFNSSGVQVGDQSGWYAVSGRYGIRDGRLYALQEQTATQVGEDDGWADISGYSYSSYAYGIRNGYLYALYGETATQVGEDDGWTDISGYSYSTTSYTYYAYGIRNGYLYILDETTATRVGNESGWTHISGYYSDSSSYASYAYGIREGKLYALQEQTATQVGNESGWTHISGYSSSSSSYYAYGIRDGRLYALQEQTATQVGNESGWTHISGKSYYPASSYYAYAYGIRNGYLYALYGEMATQVGADDGWTDISGYSYFNSRYYYYAYGIRDGKLYALSVYNVEDTIPAIPSRLTDSVVLNSQYKTDKGGMSVSETKIFNSNIPVNAENSLLVNHEGDVTSAVHSTIINAASDVASGTNNVFWNCNGTIPASGNAQSAYDANNTLTLGTDNTIAKFTNTGYAPAIGIQDVGDCPDPVNDPEGFADYIASFGDWHPQADSFLVGKGVYNSGYSTDLDGVTRPDPPTIGAYEPVPTETETEGVTE